MTASPNLSELKQCLQEAGMYEENMNEEEMRSYYNAIKSSENTAIEEDQQRNESSIISAYDVDDNVEVGEKESTDQEETLEEGNASNIEDGKVILDPLDCSPTNRKLTILYHTPRYNLPPHLDPKLSAISAQERAKIISTFHKEILQKFYELHRKSKIRLPLGNPIFSSEAFKGWSDHKSNNGSVYDISTVEQDNEVLQETYTSRSGRQTKRKVYAEDVDSDLDKKRSKKSVDDNKHKPSAKRLNLTKLSNPEIMKRSKLFADTPKSSRIEAMLEQSVVSERKRQQEEEKIEAFKQHLLGTSDDANQWLQTDETTGGDDLEELKELPPLRRRIPPPVHGRKGIGSQRTAAVAVSDIDYSKASERASVPTMQRSARAASKSPYTSTSADIKEKNLKGMTKCPICSEFFHKDEVEAHASNCGLGMKTPVNFESPADKSTKKLQCGICDKQLAMNTDYEIHVAECMQKERRK